VGVILRQPYLSCNLIRFLNLSAIFSIYYKLKIFTAIDAIFCRYCDKIE
jgi:hypothetical protein